jgi:hypothetical protein
MRLGGNLMLGVWCLANVTYRDQKVDLKIFAETKLAQIDAMLEALRTPHSQREFSIEYKYAGLTGWIEVDDILRQNLVETDNLLLMLNEMKKHPSVGPKLLDHLRDVWYTRWEQVKLNFILDLIVTLEEHRQDRTGRAVRNVRGDGAETHASRRKIADQGCNRGGARGRTRQRALQLFRLGARLVRRPQTRVLWAV